MLTGACCSLEGLFGALLLARGSVGRNIESLTLSSYTSVIIMGTGNDLANTLTGNEHANALYGLGGDDRLIGGRGADTLAGGDGLDSFWFDSALGQGIDTISDFVAADDVIVLDRSIFTGIAAVGGLNADAFRIGFVAVDADDRILYDQVSGDLYYDADGLDGAAAVLFARLYNSPVISAADFFAVP